MNRCLALARSCLLALVIGTTVAMIAAVAMPQAPPSIAAPNAAESLSFEPVGTFGGTYTGVVVSGTNAFVSRGRTLDILDVTDPLSPTLIASSAPMTATATILAVGGDRAYLAEHVREGEVPAHYDVLHVVDVTDVLAPRLGGRLRLPKDTLTSAHPLDVLLICASGRGPATVVHAADPDHPVVVGSWDLGAPVVAVAGHGADVLATLRDSNGTGRLAVLDVRNPRAPAVIGQVAIGLGAGRAVSTGQYALAETNRQRPDGMYEGITVVIDLVLPAAPTVVSETLLSPVLDFSAGDTRVWAVEGRHGVRDTFHIWSFDTEALPGFDGVRHDVAVGSRVAAVGEHALHAAGPTGLRTLERRSSGDTDEIVEVHREDTIGSPSGIAAIGRTAYVVDADNELWTLDLSRPDTPAVVGTAPMSGILADAEWSRGGPVVVSGTLAYVVRRPFHFSPGGIHVFDVSDPAIPRQVGMWDPWVAEQQAPGAYGEDDSFDVSYPPVVTGDRLLASGYPGLVELDVSSPGEPRYLRRWDMPYAEESWSGYAGGMARHGDRVWLAAPGRGVLELDISEPGGIQAIGSAETPHDAVDVALLGHHLLVATRGGLRVLDTADLHAVRSIEGPDAASIHVGNDTAYVATTDGIVAIDVSDPAYPAERGRYVDWRAPSGSGFGNVQLGTTGDLLLVADGWGRGLQIVRLVEGLTMPEPTAGPTLTPWPTRTPGTEPPTRITPLPTRTAGTAVTGTPIVTPGTPGATLSPTATSDASMTSTPIATRLPTGTGQPTRTPEIPMQRIYMPFAESRSR